VAVAACSGPEERLGIYCMIREVEVSPEHIASLARHQPNLNYLKS
jgi:hypothetical protein